MTILASALATVKPREKDGARTGARYAFQAHVSLAKVLDLHQSAASYRAVFDHFDDLVILNHPEVPDKIEFFQIKGKQTGSWTAAKLCTVQNEVPKTTIGKMYHHTVGFGSFVLRCVFLSNAPFQFTLADGTKTTVNHIKVSYNDVGLKDKARFAAALEVDFPSPRSPSEDTVLCFERTDVPVDGYDLVLKGKLVNILQGMDGVIVGGLYRALIEDVTARANNTDEFTTSAEMFASKSLSRDDLDKAFAAAEVRRDILDGWHICDDELKAAGVSSRERIRAKTAVIEYLQARSKRVSNIQALALSLRDVAKQLEAQLEVCGSLLAAVAVIRTALPILAMAEHPSSVVDAALLVEAYEAFK